MSNRETLITHPNGRCYGHLERQREATVLVVDHCECKPAGHERGEHWRIARITRTDLAALRSWTEGA